MKRETSAWLATASRPYRADEWKCRRVLERRRPGPRTCEDRTTADKTSRWPATASQRRIRRGNCVGRLRLRAADAAAEPRDQRSTTRYETQLPRIFVDTRATGSAAADSMHAEEASGSTSAATLRRAQLGRSTRGCRGGRRRPVCSRRSTRTDEHAGTLPGPRPVCSARWFRCTSPRAPRCGGARASGPCATDAARRHIRGQRISAHGAQSSAQARAPSWTSQAESVAVDGETVVAALDDARCKAEAGLHLRKCHKRQLGEGICCAVSKPAAHHEH
jgi:hypothetical protein